MYDNNDIQKIIDELNVNKELKEKVMSFVNPFDSDSVLYVLNEGYTEAFDRFDSDVCEEFLIAYEKARLL